MRKQRICVRYVGSVCLLLMSVLFVPRPAYPQAASGTITGTVTDPSGAVVPGANIVLTHVQQGIAYRTKTSSSGLYELRFLPPGEYTAEAEAPGFKKLVKTGLALVIGQVMGVAFQLQVGAATQTVEVRGDVTQMLKPESSEIGQVINYRQVVDLPLNGRNFADLIPLNAGVTTGMQRAANTGYNFNGMRSDQNMFLVEGVDNVNVRNNLMMSPSVDSIEEFQIQTGNFSAEFGRNAGGVVQVQLRSGANKFHGSLFEFLRNEKLDANGFFPNQVPPRAGETHAPKMPLKQNQYGFTLGGPIAKNKLFFFGDFQGTKQRITKSAIYSVPTMLERNGDFSQTLAPGVPILQYFYGVPYPECNPANFVTCQRIPAYALDPVAVQVTRYYPAPNIPGTFVEGLGTFNNYTTSASNQQNVNAFNIKVDYRVREADSFSIRHSLMNANNVTPAAYGGGLLGPCVDCGIALDLTAGTAHSRIQNTGLTYIHTFSPTVVNEFRGGLSRSFTFFATADGGKNLAEEMGMPNVNVNKLTSGLPFFYTLPTPSWIGTSPFTPFEQGYTVYQFTDNLSIVKGKHRIKTGLDLRRRLNNEFGNFFARGMYIFVPFFTGNAFGDFLTGRALIIQSDLTPGLYGLRAMEYGAYVQDDIKVTPRFTLNLGVRYELFPSWVEAYDRISNLDPVAGIVRLAGKDGNPRSFVNTNKRNFAPRFGFAWTPQANGRTVIRGGYGISYIDVGNDFIFAGLNPPYTGSFSVTNLSFTTFDAIYRISDGLPIELRPTLQNFDVNNPSGSWNQLQNIQASPYAQYFSLGIQRALPWDIVLDVSYVGSRGVHLPGAIEGNPAPPGPTSNTDARRLYHSTVPNVSSITLNTNQFSSIYHSFQAKLQKRWSYGLQFLGTYTWGKSIDNKSGSNHNGGGESNPSAMPQDSMTISAERARSSYDIAHRFVFSYNYDLPLGRGRHFGSSWNPVVNALLGGWQVNGILGLSTGLPFTVFATSNANCGCSSNDMRADRLADGNLPKDQRSIRGWFDKTAFTDPPSSGPNPGDPVGRYGNSARNIIRGPGLANVDFSVFKKFKIHERAELQVRAEFFNLFNRVNFLYPDTANAGWQTGGLITRSYAPRIGQLALKLTF